MTKSRFRTLAQAKTGFGGPRNQEYRMLIPAAAAWFCVVIVCVMGWWQAIIAILLVLVVIRFVTWLRNVPLAKGVILWIALASLLATMSAVWQSSQRHHPDLDERIAAAQSTQFIVTISGYCRTDSTGSGLSCPVHAKLEQDSPSSLFRAIGYFSQNETPQIGESYLVQARAQRILEPRSQSYRLRIQQVEERYPPRGVDAALAQVRLELVKRSATLPGRGAQLIPGFSIGDTVLVDDPLDEAMKTTSLSHLTAVSGSNFAMVVMALLFLGGMCGWSRLGRSLLAFGGLVIFMILVTPEPSVLRASVMATFALIAHNMGRRAVAGSALSLSVLVLLIIDPWLAIEFGFILSVAATAGLIYLATPIAAWLSRWLPDAVAMALSIPIAAQLACQPALLLLQDGIPTYGIIANLLVSIASPLATGLGLLAGILLPVLPWLGSALLWAAWIPASWIALIAEFLAAMPMARLLWVEGALGAVIAVIVLVLISWALLSRQLILKRWLSRIAMALSVLIVAVILGGQAAGRIIPSDWNLAFCDVGQGDAILVRSAGHTALIDTGPDPEKLAECLSFLEIRQLDLVVVTHFDQDHSGGLSALRNMEIANVLHAASPEDIEELGILQGVNQTHRAQAGMTGSLGNSRWWVLWPEADAWLPDRNQQSIVMQFQGELSFLSLGDLNEQSQLRVLAQQQSRLRAQVVKVAHHGSRDQSPALYDTLRASVAVFTVGQNSYGHPHPDTVDLFADATVLRTDQQGLILLGWDSPAGQRSAPTVNVWTER